ncbi:protein OBERON 3 [Phalaenopsis equestris]|uniref:protein OBERON 3 n=1 Tax=Phalaenopsis equestris TaxID=78828 RepID=UPI0009E3DA90|nr:protein OBERON 3 [Phalaenopsis equestris]
MICDTGSPPNAARLQSDTAQADPISIDLQSPNTKSLTPDKPPAISGGELTLSYLCDNPKLNIPERESAAVATTSAAAGCKVAAATIGGGGCGDEERWVERDFLQLRGLTGSKREGAEPVKPDGHEKKVKIEPLNLTLAPPDLSLSLNSSNPLPNALPPIPTRSDTTPAAVAAAAASTPAFNPVSQARTFSGNTRATNSEDFNPSLSYSCSVPFSHNPSCSLTRNSTENYDVSRDNDQMWYCGAGEGTNGSVHSRFRPVGDGNSITFSNHSGFAHLGGNNKDTNNNNNSLFKASSIADDISFYPTELPARQGRVHAATVSAESGRNAMLTRPDRVLKEIVSESVLLMAQRLHELPSNSVETVKEYLRNLMGSSDKEEFSSLQRKLERRSDLTSENLLKSHRVQLEVMVAIKTGVIGFLSLKIRIPTTELVEIFLLTRCKNLSCKSLLPVDDCDCKICTNNKGFCSACMCPICFKFDCALNTCSWVGCDVCSHWCHAICGIQRNLIKPGQSLKGGGTMTEMQFYCPGCDHASEMFGFVKEVFMCCAKGWGLETLMKELDCVRMIFHESQDLEGKELERKVDEMLNMLGKKQISTLDACNGMLHFFKYGVSDLSVTGSSSNNKFAAQTTQQENILPLPPVASIVPPKSAFSLNSNPSIFDSVDVLKTDGTPKPLTIEPKLVLPKNDGFQSLDTIVRFKEAEAKLFQRLADEARKEMENYRQIVCTKSEKLEEEYAIKLAKLCLQETEERHRKKLEELKFIENSHCDYQKMKIRMQSEIASLLERMEATRKQWV